MEKETFWSLFHDLAHWEFELFLMFVFDVVIGMILWPLLKKFSTHHRSDDQQLLDLQQKVAKLEEMLGIKDHYNPDVCKCNGCSTPYKSETPQNKEPHDP